MASYTYKGTAITGTDTIAKVFKKSGISAAKVNQTYFNKESGHVYRCETAGDASTAKWKYIRTDIVGRPTIGVKKLGAPVRYEQNGKTRLMKATWQIPDALVKATRGDRAQGLTMEWYLGIDGKDPKRVSSTGNENRTEQTVNLDNFKVGDTTYNRYDFYPWTMKKLTYVSVRVYPTNAKGNGKVKEKNTRNFSAPAAPSISGISFNTSTGVVSATITSDPGLGYAERWDTRYIVTIQNTRTGQTWQQYNTQTTSTSFGVSYNVSDYQQLAYNQYIKITIQAWNRGYAGDSATATKTYYIGYPAQATIQGVDVSSKSSSGKCTVRIKTNNSTEHPVDQVSLEYLPNVTYSTASAIPGDAAWTATDIKDDASCTALAMGVSNLIPEAGKYTWVRVKSFHASETVLYRYSDYVRVTQLETPAPTAADDEIKILSATAGADGKSAVVVLGWNADGQDDSTGTELSWSDAADTWKSTEDPESYMFTWSDGSRSQGGVTYRDSATITIKGLEEATKYYIKARRYMEGDTTTYSPYSNTQTCLTSDAPESVVASCDQYVAVGGFLQVNWTFSGNALQTSWQIVASNMTIVASGTGGAGSTQISAERIQHIGTNNTLTFTVQVSTGSGYIISEAHTVTVIEEPTLAITVPVTLTAQPFSFTAQSNSECDLIVIVTSQGITGQSPQGSIRQPEGDTVHSAVYSPAWTAGQSGYTAAVTFPAGLDFWDLGAYDVSVVAVDRTSGLRSDEQKATFAVAWAHSAPDPADYVTITPIDEVDEAGWHHQSVQIALTPPATAAATDLYDIYRMTGDGAYLIGESFPLTYTATDEYAPFGDSLTLYYRIAIRTADGDVEFADIEYAADGDKIRLDWAGGTLELEYDLSIGDTYQKDVQTRKHMDGSLDAYWNSNITRKAKLSADLIRLESQDEVVLARSLARYPGPVFVRTPDGNAYEADVQISDMSTTGLLEAIALDAVEIGLTDEFILPTPYETEEEEA